MKGKLSGIALGLLLVGCATGGIKPTTSDIEIVGPPRTESVRGGVDVAVQVRGRAGTPAVTWLAAERVSGDFISGKGVEVGPGEFNALVEIQLTAPTPSYTVVLELQDGRRCRDST